MVQIQQTILEWLKNFKPGKFRIGGSIKINSEIIDNSCLNPIETKNVFQSNGWQTVVGFQTRNPIHLAHEHLQRIAQKFVMDYLSILWLGGKKRRL